MRLQFAFKPSAYFIFFVGFFCLLASLYFFPPHTIVLAGLFAFLLSLAIGSRFKRFQTVGSALIKSTSLESDESIQTAIQSLSTSFGLESSALNEPEDILAEIKRLQEHLAEERSLREFETQRACRAERVAAWQGIARILAHEIRNPLMPIRASVENLERAKKRDQETFDRIFPQASATILEELQRMQRLVHSFGDFAKLPSPELKQIRLADVLEHLHSLYEQKNVSFVGLEKGDCVFLRADREQLTQVFINLINNAFDVSSRKEEVYVRVRLSVVSDEIEVYVEDNGPGVPEHVRDRVFEPFFSSKEKGTGVGLALVKRIVEDHNGLVWLEDSDLGGACFTVRLPRNVSQGVSTLIT